MPAITTQRVENEVVPPSDGQNVVDVGGHKFFEHNGGKIYYSGGSEECAAVFVHSKKNGYGMLCHLEAWQYDQFISHQPESVHRAASGEPTWASMWTDLLEKTCGPMGKHVEEWEVYIYCKSKPLDGNDLLKKPADVAEENWHDNRTSPHWQPMEICYDPHSKTLTICTNIKRSAPDVMKILNQHGPQTTETDVEVLESGVLGWGNDLIRFFKSLGHAALTFIKKTFLLAFKTMHRMLSATVNAARTLACKVWNCLNKCAIAIRDFVVNGVSTFWKKCMAGLEYVTKNTWAMFMAGLGHADYFLQIGIKGTAVAAATQLTGSMVDMLLPTRSWVKTWTVLGGGTGAVTALAGCLVFPIPGLLYGAAACAGGAATGSIAGFSYGVVRTIADFIDDGSDIDEWTAMKKRRLN